MNCSFPSSSSMLYSPSLTWMRLAGGKRGEGSSPHPHLPRAPGSAQGGGVVTAGAVEGWGAVRE